MTQGGLYEAPARAGLHSTSIAGSRRRFQLGRSACAKGGEDLQSAETALAYRVKRREDGVQESFTCSSGHPTRAVRSRPC